MSVHDRSDDPAFPQAAVIAVSCNDAYSFSKPNRAAIELVPGLGVRDDIHAGVTVRHRSRVAADPMQPNLRQVHLIQSELHDEVSGVGYDVPSGGLGENVTTSGLDLLGLPCGTILRFGLPQPAPTPDPVTSSAPPSAGEQPLPGDKQPTVDGVQSSPAGGQAPFGGVQSSPDGGQPAFVGGSGAAPRTVAASSGGPWDVVAAAQRASLDDATAEAVAALRAVIEAEAARSDAADPRPAVVITGLRNPCQQINRFRPGLLKEVLGKDAQGNLVRRAGVMAVVLQGGTVRPGDPITVDLPTAVPHRALDRV
ncbi:transcription elongation factor [Actinoplanes sp. NPDC049548]|uniref:transcription elongation factor n=1 Tax=Actinoplanes sp. NPDC049548 TaxID=3155152 RepID=UPI0034425300